MAPTVEALVLTTSRRSAAAALGVHHATLQARAEHLTAALGYDVTTPIAALRLSVSYLRCRLDGPW